MSGHSKWATTKHRKGAQDAARAKKFAKLIRLIEVAAREGGGDLEANATLRTAYQKAREGSVPLDTIERAIKRGTGDVEGVRYEAVTYEGYGPGGVAVLVEALTDNRNRTGAEIKNIFSKNGGDLASPGAVAWQFERKGSIELPATVEEDTLLEWVLEAGGDDLERTDEGFTVTTDPHALGAVRDALEAHGAKVTSADLVMVPTNSVPVTEASDAKRVLRLMDTLDDHDDVQNVVANFDMADELLAAYEG